MELKGKKVVFLGDSITEGACADCPEHVYHSILKDLLGLSESVNAGIGGTRIAKQRVASNNARSDLDFYLRIDELDKDADYLFIFGGTNDFGHGDSEFGNDDSEDPYTFCGALNGLYKKAKEYYGAEHVIVMTPTRRFDMDNPKGDGSRRVPCPPLGVYAQTEKRLAEKYGFSVIDLYNEKQLDPNAEEYVHYFEDGLHPNTLGHKLLAEIIAERLKAL